MSSVKMSRKILERAESLGADLAGITHTGLLKKAPSYQMFKRIGMQIGAVGAGDMPSDFRIQWPHGDRAVVVIALAHPQERPDLDWWRGRGTPGNDLLIRISHDLSSWIRDELGLKTRSLSYHLEAGGVFMKDAGVLAGLGCIGKNNMLVTRAYGPRVRLRAMLVEGALESTGPVDFDPCGACPAPCLEACPQGAFEAHVYAAAELGFQDLPGRTGRYDRYRCNLQMERDMEDAGPGASGDGQRVVKYCRRCEFACPIGRTAA